MRQLAAVSLVLFLLAGCTLFGGQQQAPVQKEPTPAPGPQAPPAKPPFDPSSLCGKQFEDYANKVFSVMPCAGGNYALYRECCGQPPAFVDAKGNEIAGDAAIAAACMESAGENICSKTLESEPILCPSYEIGSCPDYSSPVCARISDAAGEGWADYRNDCLACKEGTGGQVSYVRGGCAARGIDTKAVIETAQKENIYALLVGKELVLYAQHYGLAGRQVTIVVTRDDIKHIDKTVYGGQPAWSVTLSRDMDGAPRTLAMVYDLNGTTRLDKQQTS